MKNRIHQLIESIKPFCDAILIENPLDIFYLTGVHLSLGKLIILKDASYLIVDNRYYESCKKNPNFTTLSLENTDMQELLKDLSKLSFDSEYTSYDRFLQLKELGIDLIPLKNPVLSIRKVKDPLELIALKQAAHLCYEGYNHAKSLLKVGVSEEFIAKELEIFWLKNGGSGLSFDPIIAFGKNSSMPHYRAGKTLLKENDIVLIDIGVKKDEYHSDMTRTFFFGTPDEKLQHIHDIVDTAKKKALDLCRPGTTVGDLDKAARDYITEQGFGEFFLHSLGHGIGLEVHESPILRNKAPYKDMVLEEGMAITIEPGIYLAGIGGVRLEDTILITKEAYENITDLK